MKDKDFFETNPEAELIDEFNGITSDEMKYLALVYDYDSPFRNMTLEERKEKVLSLLGYERGAKGAWPTKVQAIIGGYDKKYLNAAKAYIDLMRDDDKETLIAYQSQLKECQDFMKRKDKKPNEIISAIKMQKLVEDLRASIKALKQELNIRDDKSGFGGGESSTATSMSLIEELNSLDE